MPDTADLRPRETREPVNGGIIPLVLAALSGAVAAGIIFLIAGALL